MKKSLLLCLLVAVSAILAPAARAAGDPGDRFLEAYFLIIDGDAAERQSDWAKAEAKYRGAIEVLNEIRAESPNWNPHILDFRLKYCAEHLDALRARLVPAEAAPAAPAPAAPPAEPAPGGSVVVEAPPETPAAPPAEGGPAMRVGDAEKLMQLAADLQKAQNRIAELETERTNLQTKLDEALKSAGPLETNARIEELLKQNQELAAQLATAQGEVAKLRQTPGIDVTQTPDYLQLKTQLTSTQTELERTKAELGQTKVELATVRSQLENVQTENRTLRASYEQVAAQLTEANRRLAAAQTAAQKDDEIIKQLRKENSLLQQIVERRSVAERPLLPPVETYHELRGWKPRKLAERGAAPSVITNVATTAAKPAREESTKGKLVATVTAPPSPKPAKPAAAPAEKPAAKPAPKPAPERPAAKPAPAKPVPARPAPSPEPPAPEPAPPPAPEPTTTTAPEQPVPEPPTPTPVAEPEPTPAPAPVPVTPPTPPPAPSKATVTARVTAPAKEAPAVPQIGTLINEARTAEKAKDYATAADRYNQVLAADPNNLLALSNLAVIRTQQGQLDEAETLLRKAAVQAPNDSASRSLLGVVFFKKGLIENAFGELTRAVALDPRNAQAHNYLGITLSEKGWTTSAEQEIKKAVDLDPNYADAHFNLAVLYIRAKPPRLEMARYHYMKAVDLGAEPDPQIDATLKRPAKPAATPAPAP